MAILPQAAAPNKGVVRHQTAQETIPPQARRTTGRVSATTQAPASAAGRLPSFGTSGWTAPRWPGSPARMRKPQRDLQWPRSRFNLNRAHRLTVRFPACIPALPLENDQCAPFRLGMAGPSPAQQLLKARHVQSKAIPGCCQAASTPGCMPHRRAPMQSRPFFWCAKRSLESMYLGFQSSCRPDSFSGIYQNHRF